ncbi:hypothetical protein EIP86_011508 [Pleurotus ostreatoroseus]|nr:hypothetical protein EIP86_011508 [Pleurotus ostreatoroseus]
MFSRRLLSSCRPLSKAGHQTLAASRRLATVAETQASTSAAPPTTNENAEELPLKWPHSATIHTGIVLNRHPIISRTPTKFERAYYAYQSRIERALHNPFPYEFYFRPGSLLEGKFNEEEAKRERKAFGRVVHLSNVKNTLAEGMTTEEPLVVMPRKSQADITGDLKSLNRKGDRNLYLVIKSKEDGKDVWKFPHTELVGEEALHEAAKRELRSDYALNMDTWIVGRIPAGLYRPPPKGSSYVFLYKAHILQGQVRPDGKKVLDFAWLTKEEIQNQVDEYYWNGVKDILSDF